MAARTPTALPVVGPQATERADAARNRRKILAAAERLVAAHGIDHVSMDRVAAEAGVGKGTIFRRFGDRAGLAVAMLDERERRFQEEFIRGDAPLGPGAPPADRLRAFGHALLDLLESHGDILLAAQSGTPCARFHAPPYRVYRAHVTSLVAEIAPDCDVDFHADALLAVLAADHHRHLRRERMMEPERLRAGWDGLVGALEALGASR